MADRTRLDFFLAGWRGSDFDEKSAWTGSGRRRLAGCILGAKIWNIVRFRGSQWPGPVAYLLLCFGWFALAVIGNRPCFDWTNSIATVIGPLKFEMTQIRGFQRIGNEYWLNAANTNASVTAVNESNTPETLTIQFVVNDRTTTRSAIVSGDHAPQRIALE